jgi:thioredoxin 1
MSNKKIFLLVNLFIIFILAGCGSKIDGESNQANPENRKTASVAPKNLSEKDQEEKNRYMVTFIELGSVNCIPCKKMQPIMKQIEEECPEVNVVFYDIRKQDTRHYARQHRIRMIPTQVFLDENGKEYYRHEGFFPKEEVKKVLVRGGVDIRGK